MCACDFGYTCPRCTESEDELREDERARDEAERYERMGQSWTEPGEATT